MNIVSINGKVAGDINYGQSQNGNSYSSFQLAEEQMTQNGKEVQYLDCIAFKHTADFLNKYVKKGDCVNITGSIRVNNWTDPNGIKHKKYEILVKEASFLPYKNFGGQGKQQTVSPQPPQQYQEPAAQEQPAQQYQQPQQRYQQPAAAQPVQAQQTGNNNGGDSQEDMWG